ncbi:hypothetical protein G7Y89_g3307 [Cudoniella acicularis]|uniref:Uncharacterized protein n=1 Tax=Cudoniella acicularis TaxID=354080 RepID=A0A8H4W5P6_9HELO|nr:hypothetical protein G7Y89_g3307 [Cudoniella acicularis]
MDTNTSETLLMSLTANSLRVLRLLPVLTSTILLMFALDEHIFLGTWMEPTFRDRANAHLPVWFQHWGRRSRYVIILGYPGTYVLAVLNLIIGRNEMVAVGGDKWYWLGLMFSAAHIVFYARKALKLLAEIKADIPKGNPTYSMGVWLKMNWTRALLTDLPAWICFIVAALKTL